MSESPALPRLGIRHLLLWMFGCGVALAVMNAIRVLNGLADSRRDFLYDAVGGIAYGTALAGLILGAVRWWQGRSMVSHPGHAFLYLAGLLMVLDLGLTLILTLLAIPHHQPWMVYLYYRQCLGYGIEAIFVSVALVAMRHGIAWRLPLIPFLLLCLSQTVWNFICLVGALPFFVQLFGRRSYGFLNVSFVYLIVAGTVVLAVVAAIDVLAFRQRRDWLHWVGVGTWLALASPHIVHWVMR